MACGCLTSQIGRDVVRSTKYGRTHHIPGIWSNVTTIEKCAKVCTKLVAFAPSASVALKEALQLTLEKLQFLYFIGMRSCPVPPAIFGSIPHGIAFFLTSNLILHHRDRAGGEAAAERRPVMRSGVSFQILMLTSNAPFPTVCE